MKRPTEPSGATSRSRPPLSVPLLLCALAVALLAPSTCAGAEALPSATAGPAAVLKPCKNSFLKGGPLCGSIRVPENRKAKAGRTIDLNVMVLPALEPGEAPAQPLVYLAGGPGGPATQVAPVFEMLMPDLRKRFDLVLVDQRGTGGSNPLQCSYGSFEEAARAVILVDVAPEKLAACRSSFQADTRFYTTPEAVEDLEEVRRSLGYAAWNLFGQSYGTRVALVYLRRHPESVRSVVLQGAVPTTLHMPAQLATDVDAAMNALISDCAENSACRGAFPDLLEHLDTVVKRLEASPAEVEVADSFAGGTTRLRLDRDLFVATLRVLLHSAQTAALVPLAIEGAGRDDFSPVLPILTRWTEGMAGSFNLGLYLSVVCTEDLPFAPDQASAEPPAGSLSGPGPLRYQLEACREWPRGTLPEGYGEPVVSEVPALVISGGADPMTGSRWGEQVAATLRKATHLIIPHAGHADAIGACEQRIMADFFQKGSLEGLETSCAAAGRPRTFPPAPPSGG